MQTAACVDDTTYQTLTYDGEYLTAAMAVLLMSTGRYSIVGAVGGTGTTITLHVRTTGGVGVR